jgi:hypothetical protein
MSKDTVNDYSATAGNNTDIDGVNIAENCSPANINNALRSLMEDIADVIAGNVRATNWHTTSLNVSGTATIGTISLTTASATTLTISGNGTIGGTFGVTGAATLSSTLAVTGAITGSSTITGDAFIPTDSAAPTNGVYLPAANSVGLATASTERFRISADGAWGLAGANYGTSGYVLTSNGSGSAPTWQSAATSYNPSADVTAPGYRISLPVNSSAATIIFQSGTATTGGGGSVAVTFPTAFSSAPYVIATAIPGSQNNVLANAVTPTTTAVTLWAFDTGGSTYPSMVIHWMAMGPA